MSGITGWSPYLPIWWSDTLGLIPPIHWRTLAALCLGQDTYRRDVMLQWDGRER